MRVARAGGIGDAAAGSGRNLHIRSVTAAHAGALLAFGGDEPLGVPEHVGITDAELLAGHAQLVVVADIGQGPLYAPDERLIGEHGQLLPGVKDEAHALLSVEVRQTGHVVHVTWRDDGEITGTDKGEAVGTGFGQGAGEKAGDLVALKVCGNVAKGRELIVHDTDTLCRDAHFLHMGEVAAEVFAGSGHDHRVFPKEGQRIGNVAGTAAPALVHAVHHEADIEHMQLIHEDVILEVPMEGHDAVKSQGTGNVNGHALPRLVLLDSGEQVVHGVLLFPGELGKFAAEVTVAGSLGVDGALEIETLRDEVRAQIEDVAYGLSQNLIGIFACALGGDKHAHGFGDADAVSDLDFTDLCEAGSHNVLGNVAAHVRCRAVNLGRILAGEGAATVMAGAAVGVLDNLASGEAAVAHGAAHDKTSGGIDEDVAVLFIEEAGGFEHGADDLALHGLDDVGLGRALGMLGGHDHVVDAHGAAVLILEGDLGLAVGTEEINDAFFAHFGETHGELMGPVDGSRHQRGGLVAGVAEHHALVAGTLILGLLAVDALGDVRGLMIDGGDDSAGAPVKAHFGIVVTDIADGAADYGRQISVPLGGDFAANERHARGHERFTGHMRVGILLKKSVEDGVGNLVGDFIGMTFGDGLRGKIIGAFGLHDAFPPWIRAEVCLPAGAPAGGHAALEKSLYPAILI